MKSISSVFISKELQEQLFIQCLVDLNFGPRGDKQSYGLLVGRIDSSSSQVYVKNFFPLINNYRENDSLKKSFECKVNTLGYKGSLSTSKRGWISDPIELSIIQEYCDNKGLTIIGGFHMHHENSWDGQPDKRYPSNLDKKLAEYSNQMMFIVSILASGNKIKCFYEGECEVSIKEEEK